jgi:four helix bundle protein
MKRSVVFARIVPVFPGMRDPAKLRVVAEARELALATYATTARFPNAERFGLTAQMRRAAVSVGCNVVEGCHRAGNRALVVFLYNALGSAAELQFQIELSLQLAFGDRAELQSLHTRATDCKKMLSRLIASLRRREDR